MEARKESQRFIRIVTTPYTLVWAEPKTRRNLRDNLAPNPALRC